MLNPRGSSSTIMPIQKRERDSVPRLTVNITEEQRAALDKLLPWGTGRSFFSAIIDDCIRYLSDPELRGVFMAKVMNKQFYLNEVITEDQAGIYADIYVANRMLDTLRVPREDDSGKLSISQRLRIMIERLNDGNTP